MTWEETLQRVIDSWRGTPYVNGQCRKRSGVDCVRFVDAVLSESFSRNLPPLPRLPADASLHDRRGAVMMVREMLRRHPSDKVSDGTRLPGDVVIYKRGLAPGHVLIVGINPALVWHADEGSGVAYTGWAAVEKSLMRVLRPRRDR